MSDTPAKLPRRASITASPGSVTARSSGIHPAVRESSIADLATEISRRLSSRRMSIRELRNPDKKWLGKCAADIERLLHDEPTNRFSAAKSLSLVRILGDHPDSSYEWIAGRACVDVGCGGMSPFGPLFGLLLAGAESGVGVDMDSLVDERVATRALYTCLSAVLTKTASIQIPGDAATILERLESFDLGKIATGDVAGINPARLSYIRAPFEGAGLQPASVDLVMSVSFLEHVPCPDTIIEEMARVSKPGALGTHVIDGVDHRAYADPDVHPLKFLQDLSGDQLVFGCNRIRPLEFAPIFERHGFEIRAVSKPAPIKIDDALRRRFALPYRYQADAVLGCLRATIHVAKKP